jgi:hypothetical protein
MKRNMMTLTDLLRGYEPEIGDSKSMRIAKLLRYVETELPGSYIPKRYVAKAAFALPKLPGDKSDYIGPGLTNLIRSAEMILRRESGDYIERHRFIGIRLTHTSQAKLVGPLRAKRKQAEGLFNGIQEVLGNIKPEELTAEGKREFSQYKKFNPLLEQFRKEVPLLESPKVIEDDNKKKK